MEIVKELPKKIQESLAFIAEESGITSLYYLDKLEFCIAVYSKYKTYEEIWKNVSRMQCLRITMREKNLIQEKELGIIKLEAIKDLVASAKETL